jgi:hypothetical protein
MSCESVHSTCLTGLLLLPCLATICIRSPTMVISNGGVRGLLSCSWPMTIQEAVFFAPGSIMNLYEAAKCRPSPEAECWVISPISERSKPCGSV